MPIWPRVRRLLIGGAKDVRDPNAFHKLSLVALLAWVGLGRDGLSSSAYGPDDAAVDSDVFKGTSELEALEKRTRANLESYERLAAHMGLPATSVFAVGTEVAVEAKKLATAILARYPKALVERLSHPSAPNLDRG